ncbi:MAG: TolC family protein [Rubricoccaceae bacterium]|nr:TolC family protein [Rubricoccaceae bacterium]
MRLTVTLGLLALVVALPVRAQQAITFEEAIGLALERNADLRLAEVTRDASGLNVSSARADALPLPFVSANIGPTQRYGLSFDQTTGQLVSQTSESLSLSASASVDLFSGFRSRRALEQARHQQDAAVLGLERTREQVAFDVASRFLQVMLDEEIVRIREQNVNSQELQLEQVEELVDAGVRAEADVFSQRAGLAQAQGALLQAEQAVELSKTRLVEVLQLDPFGEYEFIAPSIEGESLVPEDISLDELLNAAYASRADLQAQELTIEAAEAGVSMARSGRYPTVSFSAGFGTNYSSLQQRLVNPNAPTISLPLMTEGGETVLLGGEPFEVPIQTPSEFEDTPFLTQLSENRGGSIGLNISIPIFDRYQTSRQVQQAQIQVMREEIALERMRQSVAVEVRQALLDYRNAGEQLDVTEAQVAAAEAALEAEQSRYEFGTGTLVAVTQARTQFVEAQSARVQAVYQFVFRRKLIDFALGNLEISTVLFD